MILLLLLPSYLYILQKKMLYISLPSDKYVYGYVALLCLLAFRDTSFTNGLRISFTVVVDIFLPYFVISRLLTSQKQLHLAFTALLLTSIILAFASIFEAVKHWHLYSAILKEVGNIGVSLGYLDRADTLRAGAVFGSPIALGYMLVIASGLLIYFKPYVRNKYLFYFLFIIMVTALISSLSRGPWIGFAVLVLAFLWTGKHSIRNIFTVLSSGVAFILIISQIPQLDRITQLLPFLGTSASETVKLQSNA